MTQCGKSDIKAACNYTNKYQVITRGRENETGESNQSVVLAS